MRSVEATLTVEAVVVTPQLPLPEGSAAGRCAVGLLRGLESHDVGVRCIAARAVWDPPARPPDDLPVEVVGVPAQQGRWRSRLRELRLPISALDHPSFHERVAEASRTADVLHLEQVETARCGQGLPLPSVMNLHYRVRLDRPLGAPWRPQFRYVLQFSRIEHLAIRRHRQIVVSSLAVADAVRREAGKREVLVVPLTVDPSTYRAAPLDGPPVLGTIGSAFWPPTAESIRRLAHDVWPIVRRTCPDAVLRIAGRGVADLDGVADLAGAGVEIVGEVPSSAEFLSGLSALVHPLTRGSGMKVKVLEAIAVGLPVVATPCGAEGFAEDPGIQIATTDGDLAEAAARILVDEDERRERGASAHRLFERRYSPRPATEPLVDLYRRMAG